MESQEDDRASRIGCRTRRIGYKLKRIGCRMGRKMVERGA
jgi:hypothetical protein